MRATPTWTAIRMYPKTNYLPGRPVLVSLASDTTLRLAGTFHRFAVGAVPVGEEARKVTDGPMVEGPWAYAVGLCTVIDNYPERRKAEYDRDVIVDQGDVLEIDSFFYVVHVVRGEFIELLPTEKPYVAPTVGKRTLTDSKAKHAYEITATRDILGNPVVRDEFGEQFDIIRIRVEANSRTQAAARVKNIGYRPDDVNMIG